MEWLYLAVAILAEVIATTALKASRAFTVLMPSLLAMAGYAIALYLLSLTLNRIPLGVAYAVWSAAGVVLITVASAVRFGEYLDAPAIIGIGMIVGGVVTIKLFSSSVAQ